MKRTLLITGCSTGFGNATARYFAASGWNVIATMRKVEAGHELAEIPGIYVTRLDVQDASSINTAIERGIAQFGRIDALVNNAGFGLHGVFESTPPAKIKEQFGVNVFGVMDVTRAILPHFRANKQGIILNVSSGAGVFTLPMLSLYCASKFALEGFSEALTYELGPLGIIVKIIEPGGVISTNFGVRSGQEAEVSPIDADYQRFTDATDKIFDGLRGHASASADDVAKVIFDAANDGSTQLRYVATDDIRPLVAARRETSETEYVSFMRNQFMIAH